MCQFIRFGAPEFCVTLIFSAQNHLEIATQIRWQSRSLDSFMFPIRVSNLRFAFHLYTTAAIDLGIWFMQ